MRWGQVPSPSGSAGRDDRLCCGRAVVTSVQEVISPLGSNALNVENAYKGRRITVSAFVGDIDASGDYSSLDPEPDAFILTGVQVQTDEDFLDQVASSSAGQAVTVTGTISDVVTVTWADEPGGTERRSWSRPLPPQREPQTPLPRPPGIGTERGLPGCRP